MQRLRSRSAFRLARCAVLWAAVGIVPSCGGDDGGGEDAGAEGEECPQAGLTMTGCACEGRPGVRHCTEELVWTACDCPPALPPSDECQREGQPVRCDPCPGQTVGRDTYCSADLTFDCLCPGGGGDDAGALPDASPGP